MSLLRSLENYCATCSINITRLWRSRIWEFASSIKVERLPSNIGYLKFNGFQDPEICGPTVAAAMNFLAHVDALIIDLRDNGGGDPKMVAYISSHLFAEPTHLNDLYNRKEDKTTEFWSLRDVPGARLADKPVFALTSKRAFSGAEKFAYNLKNLERATIIGETTVGGAHPVSGHRIDDHFIIDAPFARAINPISKTNWEGTGVAPDIKVPASEALDAAKRWRRNKSKRRDDENPNKRFEPLLAYWRLAFSVAFLRALAGFFFAASRFGRLRALAASFTRAFRPDRFSDFLNHFRDGV